MGIPGYLELMGSTASGYEFLTVNAFNPWALVGVDGPDSPLALGDALLGRPTPCPLLGPLPAVAIGALLLVAGFLYGLANACCSATSGGPSSSTAIFLCLCFFVLPTRVHERYLMPVFALVPLLAVTSRAWLVALVALAIGGLINLHGGR